GLPEIIISYESGMDRSPEYDIIYGRSTAGSLLRGPLARILVHHWRLKHDLPRIIAAQRFRVKDLLFNCVYARNQYILAGLLDTAGETALAQSFRERARLTEAAILSKMYSPGTGLFHSLDARYDRDVPVPVATLSTFMPLLLPAIPLPMVEVLAGRLSDPQSFGAHYPVPVEPLSAYAQTPRTHIIWRGMQSWILPNWLIYQGLLLQAHRFPSLAAELTNLAQGLAQRSYELVQQHGFWEYYHSETGKPGGAVHFAWSGLVWNMSQPEQAEAGFFGHLYP
ncbi:MAG: hypothetical protein HYX99_02515, partial [Chloroflexi bacterium]|nr:hypothetical protein [Chloroflexota bacterium]